MTKEELAARLNGREYMNDTASQDVRAAETDDLLIVFGASDNLCELCGALSDEVGCYGGGTILIDPGKRFPRGMLSTPTLLESIETDEEAVLRKHGAWETVQQRRNAALRIEALWCQEDHDGKIIAPWTYKTAAPHATFDIMEDGELYCRGIVIDLNEVVP